MRQVVILCSIITIMTIASCGQKETSFDHDETSCFETHPTFPGGLDSLKTFIKKNLKYPRSSADYEGPVFISFTIKEDGSPTNFLVIKGLCDLCDENAIEALKKMPKWIPAMENDKPIRVKTIIPIRFSL